MVLIVGTNLDPLASVTYDGIPAASVTVDPQSGGLVTVTPPHPEGFVDVVVTNPDGQSAVAPNFHYGPPPTISSVTPTTSIRNGTIMTITGTNFADVYDLQVGIGSSIAPILSKSPTQIVISAPKMNQGLYQLFVANFDSQYVVMPGWVSVSGGGGGGGGGSGH
jgi:IPT/TIG domain